MQEEIDSYDSQLDKTIKSALTFSTSTIPRIMKKFTGTTFDKDCKLSEEEKRDSQKLEDDFDNECIEDMLDTYKDDIFGEAAKVSMENFNKNMSTT